MKSRILRKFKGVLSEEGSSLVEMAVAASTMMAMLLGIFELSLGLYGFHFASDAAREATRFAMVRGSNCGLYINKAYCSPTDANTTGADSGDIQAFVTNLGYPYASHMTATTNWYTASSTTPTTWATKCASGTCNAVGNMVQVQVTWAYPLNIPFLSAKTINITSTSAMVIQQ
jgi:Flp pilus assembly protein TadG